MMLDYTMYKFVLGFLCVIMCVQWLSYVSSGYLVLFVKMFILYRVFDNSRIKISDLNITYCIQFVDLHIDLFCQQCMTTSSSNS